MSKALHSPRGSAARTGELFPVAASTLHRHPVVTGVVAAVAAGTLLIAPGLHSHAQTPEPAALASTTYRVVGLGDSVMTANACKRCESFLQTAARRLAARSHQSPWVGNYAQDGADTADVLRRLGSPVVREAVRDSDLVVIQAGANDFSESDAGRRTCLPARNSPCYARTAATMRTNLARTVATVQGLQRRRGAQVVLLGYWNVFRDGQVGARKGVTYVKGSDQLTRWTNSLTRDVARNAGVRYVNVYTPFKGRGGRTDPTRLLLADGDHPNAAGHLVLARALVSAVTA